jgi:hypothetical protein
MLWFKFRLKLCKTRLILLMLSFISFKSAAIPQKVQVSESHNRREDDFWVSVSPEVGGVIRSGELYLILKRQPDYENEKLSVRIFLSELFENRIELTHLAKETGKQLSLVCTRPLAEGGHKLVIETTSSYGHHSELQIPFQVGSPEKSRIYENIKYKRKAGIQEKIPKPFPLKAEGTLQLTSLNYRLTGSNPELRQEPAQTQEIDFRTRVIYKQFSFPIRLFLTSTDSQSIQSRNRFQWSMEHRLFRFNVGDISPNFDKLILGGIRTRGLSAEVRINKKKIILSGVLGYTQRSIEGQIIRYNPGQMVLPINLQPDSTFISKGTYSRYLGCFSLTIGKQRERNQLSLIFLKSRDDSSSIRFGERPKDNVVAGLDFDLTSPGQKVIWKAGFAISMTTYDITQPILTKEVLKKEYKVDVDYNLKNWAWLIIYNPSTTPLKPETGVSMAWFSNARFKIKKHNLTLDARQTGPQYQSFGNPFLRTDLLSLGISESGRYFKDKISLQAGFQLNQDNIAQTQLSTRRTKIWSATAGINPAANRPFLNAGFRIFQRLTKFRGSDVFLNSDELTTVFSSGGLQISKNGFLHSIIGGGSLISRNAVQKFNENKSWTAFGTISESFPIPLSLSLTYSWMELNQAGMLFQNLQRSLGGSLSWEFRKLKLLIAISSGRSMLVASDFLSPSLRQSKDFSINWSPKDAFDFRLTAGLGDFQELVDSGKNYRERFIRFNGCYRFKL